ncbi:MAG: helix-turn-helix transcriptional regulator [Planctomycetes bacterium]|nr:helix-turn-helix transcriptional regulator [Planctomycetota bacterium]
MPAAFDLRKIDLENKLGPIRGFGSGGYWRHILAMFKAHGKEPNQHPNMRSDFLGINFVLRGRGRYSDEKNPSIALQPGTLFHRFPGRLHSTWFDSASDYAEFFIATDPRTAAELVRIGLVSAEPVLAVGVYPGILDEFLALQKTLASTTSEIPTPLAFVRTLEFIHGLYERARQNRLQSYWERIVSDACSLLERNIEARFSMEKVAAQLGVSYTSFRKNFHRIAHCAPGAYRVRFRLARARELLLTGSVKQVAASLGYGDPFTFSAQFKAQVGLSPRAFQRAQRKALSGGA